MTPATALKVSEIQFQRSVMDLAKTLGLLVHHCRAVRVRVDRVVTPISGKPGFPDLVITGPSGVIFRELKVAKNQPTADQVLWLATLTAGGADAKVWRPADMASGEIAETLARLARKRAAS